MSVKAMTYEEAARILDPETNLEALRAYAGDCEARQAAIVEACRLGARALRAMPSSEPLTLEHLLASPHGKIKDSTLQSICNRANEIACRPPEEEEGELPF